MKILNLRRRLKRMPSKADGLNRQSIQVDFLY
jgi:hypothetical protein